MLRSANLDRCCIAFPSLQLHLAQRHRESRRKKTGAVAPGRALKHSAACGWPSTEPSGSFGCSRLPGHTWRRLKTWEYSHSLQEKGSYHRPSQMKNSCSFSRLYLQSSKSATIALAIRAGPGIVLGSGEKSKLFAPNHADTPRRLLLSAQHSPCSCTCFELISPLCPRFELVA